jgi:hypothetical protein
MVHPSQVTCAAGSRLSSGFCVTTPTAYEMAAVTQRMTPHVSARPVEVEMPISRTPPNATRLPITTWRGKPSPRVRPASKAISSGAMWISMAAVPASRRRSASFKARL